MRYIIHKLNGEEKLAAIAAKYHTTEAKIKELNPDAHIFRAFPWEPFTVGWNEKLKIPVEGEEEKISLETVKYNKEIKYRCEQNVISKINGIIQNHANTKQEFVVKKRQSPDNLIVNTELTDNIIEIYPPQLTEAMKLLSDLELVKCNAVLYVDSETGKMDRILNHDEIVKQWRNHKAKLQEKYGFIRSPQTREELNKFITLAENQIINERSLIQDLNTKLFFNLLFDKYLVTNSKLFEPYTKKFQSHLFENTKVNFTFKQEILSETEDKVNVMKTGAWDKKENSLATVEKMYDEKYKPFIKYKFSDYSYKYNVNYIINTKEHWIETAEVMIMEEVINNIQIGISFNLKKIE